LICTSNARAGSAQTSALILPANNAADFRRLHGQQDLHVGLIILVPHVPPALQRQLFETLLEALEPGEQLINEVIEISIEDGLAVFDRYTLPSEG
jgi:hypothetical protein